MRSSARDNFSVNDGSPLALGIWTVNMVPELPDTNIAQSVDHTGNDVQISAEALFIDVAPHEVASSTSALEAHHQPTRFVELIEDTESDFDYEPFFLAHRDPNKPFHRRYYVEKVKGAAKKISGKAHDLAKSNKHFARTLCGFVLRL
jgi:hypothetical protein